MYLWRSSLKKLKNSEILKKRKPFVIVILSSPGGDSGEDRPNRVKRIFNWLKKIVGKGLEWIAPERKNSDSRPFGLPGANSFPLTDIKRKPSTSVSTPLAMSNRDTAKKEFYRLENLSIENAVLNYSFQIIGKSLTDEGITTFQDPKNVQKANALIKQFLLGNPNPGKGTKRVTGTTFSELRADYGSRVYFRVEKLCMVVYGISGKPNQKKVLKLLGPDPRKDNRPKSEKR